MTHQNHTLTKVGMYYMMFHVVIFAARKICTIALSKLDRYGEK